MRTLALTVAYDGTDWAGFQRQAARPSIQGALETALSAALQHPVAVLGAGRTDAGVHALGQVVSLCTANPLPLERVARVVNRWLPPSIRVRRAWECPSGFHARLDARYRRYWYVVQMARRPDPLRGRFSWQVDRPLNVAAMRVALQPLVGRHDFQAFCQEGPPPGESAVRTVQRARVHRWRDAVIIEVQADAFLRRMVRLLVANVVQVGWGDRPVNWLGALLQGRNRHPSGMAAPSTGLILMRVGYAWNGQVPEAGQRGVRTDEELSGEIA
ncbi:MAG TPA: tRNA pseudouridine(38-40) synthase TruA [Armatimonadota bacterium]|nr:tRNA pseudouridine(38-40) synthase TruA [Armatimonadota bacterium]HOS44532.1 tRNA pseudouridine(38-40) synthase TruA [Armatimonadota bacterium]